MAIASRCGWPSTDGKSAPRKSVRAAISLSTFTHITGTKAKPRITISEACVLFTPPSNLYRTQSRKMNSTAQINSETMPRRKSPSDARMFWEVAAVITRDDQSTGDIDDTEEASRPVHQVQHTLQSSLPVWLSSFPALLMLRTLA